MFKKKIDKTKEAEKNRESNPKKEVEAKKKEFRPNPILVPFSIIIAGALIAGAIIYNGRLGFDAYGNSSNTSSATSTATPPAISTSTVTVSLKGAYLQGDTKANVALVEFGDYQCPYCKSLHDNTIEPFRNDYVNKNKVLYAFKNFPLTQIHPNAMIGAIAAMCAGGQNKFWQMNDAIYATDQSNNDQNALEAIAKNLGLNTDQFNSCISNNTYKNQIQADIDEGNSLNIQGTPTVIVGKIDHKNNTVTGNVVYGAYPYSTFQTALAKYL